VIIPIVLKSTTNIQNKENNNFGKYESLEEKTSFIIPLHVYYNLSDDDFNRKTPSIFVVSFLLL